jgi:ABC transport system ATP-binding/permease protein
MAFLSIDRRQAGVLADRYLDVLLGDWGALFLMVLQAPMIGALIAGVWANRGSDTLTLYFVLGLSAFFLGAVNSSREIVKERALFLRERMFNLSVGAYLYSKYRVQAIFVVIQCVLLVGTVRWFVPLVVNELAVGLFCALTAFAGTAVGLLISSWVRTTDKAVAAVPLVVIPQILFSDFVLGEKSLKNWTSWAEKLMPVRWAYDALKQLRMANTEWGEVALSAAVVLMMIGACFLLAYVSLLRSED